MTLIAGIHGDEFEGPLALQRLGRELDANDICGCLILVPSVNLPAVSNGSRFSPLDGRDLDACFPGASHGTVSEHCLLYTSPSPRDGLLSRMPSSA